MSTCCPQCHRPLGSARLGVFLPQLKAEILDHIKAAGDIGISSAELVNGDLYRDRRPVRPDAIKSHIFQLNELLIDSGWRIASAGGRWTLVRKRQGGVA
jgi:hypothetical protein